MCAVMQICKENKKFKVFLKLFFVKTLKKFPIQILKSFFPLNF